MDGVAGCSPLTVRARGLVDRSFFSPYKLSQAGGWIPEEIPKVAVWHTRPGSDRQHHSDALYEQCGRDQVQVLGQEGSGDYSVVSELEDHIVGGSHFGTGQCQGIMPLSISGRNS